MSRVLLHLLALPDSVLADGVDWEEPLNGGPAITSQGQRRKGRPAFQDRKQKAGKRAKGTNDKGANSPVVRSNVIGPYDKKYKGTTKTIPRRNGCKRGSK